MEARPDSEALTAYLLGELPEDEAASIEDAYFADDELFEELRAAEADVIDAYVAGALSDRRAAAFEERMLATPEQRERVAFARALAAKADASAAPAPARGSLWDRVRAMFTIKTMAVAGAAALALVIGVQVLGVGAGDDPTVITLRATSLRSTGTAAVLEVPAGEDEVEVTLELDINPRDRRFQVALLREGQGTRILYQPVKATKTHVTVVIPAGELGNGLRTFALTDAAGRNLAFYELVISRR